MSVQTTPAPFILGAWYAAAESAELDATHPKPLARTVLEQRLVLFRDGQGRAGALRDRCPHRFAPLSLGQRVQDGIACPYHGLVFGTDGACRRAPGQDRPPPAARVDAFRVLEAYGLVFVWMGDPEDADPGELVEIAQYGAPGWGLSRGYDLFGACWQNIADNLVDPAHTSFVHQRTIGNDAGNEVRVGATEEAGVIRAGRWVDNAPAVPVVRRYTGCEGPMDRWQFYNYRLPCTSWVDFGSFEAGRPHTAEEQERAPYRVLSYAFLTPQTRNSTHYFSFQLRNFSVDDEATTREFESLYKLTFGEDKELLEAIQREEDACPGLVPVRMATDTGVVRLRRRIAEMSRAGGGAGS